VVLLATDLPSSLTSLPPAHTGKEISGSIDSNKLPTQYRRIAISSYTPAEDGSGNRTTTIAHGLSAIPVGIFFQDNAGPVANSLFPFRNTWDARNLPPGNNPAVGGIGVVAMDNTNIYVNVRNGGTTIYTYYRLYKEN